MTFWQIAAIALGSACFTVALALGIVGIWIIRPLSTAEQLAAEGQQSAIRNPQSAIRAIPSSRATALKDEAFVRAWQQVPEGDPLLAAVHQLLALDLIEAIDYAARPDLAERPGALAQAQGSVNALMTLAGNLDLARIEPERWTAAGARKQARR